MDRRALGASVLGAMLALIACGDTSPSIAEDGTQSPDGGGRPDASRGRDDEPSGPGGSEADASTGGGEGADGAAEAAVDAAPSNVKTFDLTRDWSDTQNPNGAWRVRDDGNVISPAVNDWARISGQTAWAHEATGNGQIPAFMKVVAPAGLGANELRAGDICVHSRDDNNGKGRGEAQIVWTSPEAGTIDISGGIWLGRTNRDRSNTWTLTVKGALKASGLIQPNDPSSRATPWTFSSRATAPLKALPVAARDEVVLEIRKAVASSAGEYTGVTLTIALTPR